MHFRSQVLTLLTFFFLAFPLCIRASTYGSGNYGSSVYGGGTTNTSTTAPNSGSSGTSQTAEAGCSDTAPATAPWLYGAIPQSDHSILLYFTDSGDPVDRYVLQYGYTSDAYNWGASDIGKKGVRTYLVQSLQANTTYHFRVSGANGCANGPWSNDISATTGRSLLQTGFSPALTTKSLELTPEPTTQAIEAASPSALPHPEKKVYEVTVRVIDTNKQPLENAKVSISSQAEPHTTDANGGVTFQNVDAGEHSVSIQYQDKETKSSLYLDGDQLTRILTITVETVSPLKRLTPLHGIGIVTILTALILGGVVAWKKRA